MTPRGRILVTPRSLTAGGTAELAARLELLIEAGYELVSGPAGRLPDAAELAELVPGVDGWLAGVEPISAEILAHADRLRAIARNGTGAENIDHIAAAHRGIRVFTAPGANAQGVAELALALALAGLRDVVRSDRELKTGAWTRAQGRELADIRVGVAGYGAIGRRVATMFSTLGAAVTVYDPFAADPLAHERAASFGDLAACSDVLTLHAPPPADGSRLVDVGVLAEMPAGAILVNTARSALVDADAVADALDSERLGLYAVDAFDQEPPVLDRLLRHERTVMTPHAGGFTAASVQRATDAAVSNLIAALSS